MEHDIPVIRNVGIADAAQITNILNHYIVHSVAIFDLRPIMVSATEALITALTPRYPWLVASIGDQVLGYCYAHPWKSKAAYDISAEITLYVHPEHVLHGIGSSLLRGLIEECRKVGLHSLIACVTCVEPSLLPFYEKFGFRQVSHFTDVGVKFGRLLSVDDLQLMLASPTA